MRIAKAIARAGLASRREAERFIAEGRVTLNGSPVTSPAVNVSTSDAIVVDGRALPVAERPRLWRYHKPKGLVTTHSDPQGRPTVFQSLPPDLPRVISVGRLDFNTEGLLLLTNHGGLARHLELPSTGWLRRYRVRAYGRVSQRQLDPLREGLELEGVRYGPIEASVEREQGSNVWLAIGLREGKNREVKKVLASLHLAVTRLIRVSFGPFALGELSPGEAEEIKPRVIAEQVGEAFAAGIGLKVPAASPPRRKGGK
jgi:23S rRNA pseudouridine2605 synthase